MKDNLTRKFYILAIVASVMLLACDDDNGSKSGETGTASKASCEQNSDCVAGICDKTQKKCLEAVDADVSMLLINEVMGSPKKGAKFSKQKDTEQCEFVEIISRDTRPEKLDGVNLVLNKVEKEGEGEPVRIALSGIMYPNSAAVISPCKIPVPDDVLWIETEEELAIEDDADYVIWLEKGDDRSLTAERLPNDKNLGISQGRVQNGDVSDAALVLHSTISDFDNSPGYCTNGQLFSRNCAAEKRSDVNRGEILSILMINEVMGSPVSANSTKYSPMFDTSPETNQCEFIEIVNLSDKEVDTDGVILTWQREKATKVNEFELKGIIPAKGGMVVGGCIYIDDLPEDVIYRQCTFLDNTSHDSIANKKKYFLWLSYKGIEGEKFERGSHEANGKSRNRKIDRDPTSETVLHNDVEGAVYNNSPGRCVNGGTFSNECQDGDKHAVRGEPCKNDAQCEGNLVCDSDAKVCGDRKVKGDEGAACTSDNDCKTNDNLSCIENKCTKVDAEKSCKSDEECTEENTFCSIETQTCVPYLCDEDGDCEDMEICDPKEHACKAVDCIHDTDCKGESQICSLEEHQCIDVECIKDEVCGEKKACNMTDHKCEAVECTLDSHCDNGNIKCNTETHKCEGDPCVSAIKGDIFINEILNHIDADANFINTEIKQFEMIELYNASEKNVDISNLSLYFENIDNAEKSFNMLFSDFSACLKPGQIVLIHSTDNGYSVGENLKQMCMDYQTSRLVQTEAMVDENAYHVVLHEKDNLSNVIHRVYMPASGEDSWKGVSAALASSSEDKDGAGYYRMVKHTDLVGDQKTSLGEKNSELKP